MPVYWGILKAVEESEENLVLRRAEPNDKDILMYAAGKLLGKENTLEGYIVSACGLKILKNCSMITETVRRKSPFRFLLANDF